jgi:hypothetical protein
MGPALASHITRLRLELGATCPKIIGLTSSLVKSPIGALDTLLPASLLNSLIHTGRSDLHGAHNDMLSAMRRDRSVASCPNKHFI